MSGNGSAENIKDINSSEITQEEVPEICTPTQEAVNE